MIARRVLEAIEELVWMHDISYMDAVVLYSEQNNVEIEALANIVKNNENLKGVIQLEAEGLNYLPKSNTLPV